MVDSGDKAHDVLKPASLPAHNLDDSFTSTEESQTLLDTHHPKDSCASMDKSRTHFVASSARSSNAVDGGGLHKFFQQQGRDELVAILTVAAF